MFEEKENPGSINNRADYFSMAANHEPGLAYFEDNVNLALLVEVNLVYFELFFIKVQKKPGGKAFIIKESSYQKITKTHRIFFFRTYSNSGAHH